MSRQRPPETVPQMHVRLDPDLLMAMDLIREKITGSPALNVQVTKRKGKLTHSTVIRYALGRCLAELAGG